jgi:hypothetical protein
LLPQGPALGVIYFLIIGGREKVKSKQKSPSFPLSLLHNGRIQEVLKELDIYLYYRLHP